MSATSDEKKPHSVDIHVGAKVKLRRRFLGLSQDQLAREIGITFQQVQKYERGLNRISASKLYEISQALQTPLPYFFEGYESKANQYGVSAPEQAAYSFLSSSEGLELAEAFPRIRTAGHRRRLLELVRALADEG